MGELLVYPLHGKYMKVVAIMIAVATEVAALCLLVWSSINAHHGHVHKDIAETLEEEDSTLDRVLENYGFWKGMRAVRIAYAICAFINAAECVMCIFLMAGAYTGRAQTLRAWILFTAFWLLANALLVPCMAVMGVLYAAHVSGFVVFLIMVFAIPGELYLILVIRRYHKALLENDQQDGDYPPHARLTVNS